MKNAAPAGTVTLKIERNSPHPWIYRRMVEAWGADVKPGDVVRVVDRAGKAIGRGFFNPRSEIALRLLTEAAAEEVDAAFFRERIRQAAALRREFLHLDRESDAWRVVHSEGDGLSGLIVDRYADLLSVELFSLGVARAFPWIRAALEQEFPGAQVVARADERVEEREGFKAPEKKWKKFRTVVTEHGVKFHVDLVAGHKTGFFLDQRDNRRFLGGLVAGREVLDLFCYTGGFALHAAAGRAKSVVGVDLDERSLETARANAELNGLAGAVEFRQGDVFHFLKGARAERRRWDVVVLDPPKFAPSKGAIEEAARDYLDLNRMGVAAVRDGGVLVTCSCSGALPETEFLDFVRRAAASADRELQVFRIAGAGPDHPVSSSCPETRYLKVVFARVVRRG
jgi:23S rRNA (cytosine1962-C5)-methyltransferase